MMSCFISPSIAPMTYFLLNKTILQMIGKTPRG